MGLPARRLRTYGEHAHQPAAREDRGRSRRARADPHGVGRGYKLAAPGQRDA
jgi:hypothetical protein